MRAKPKPASPAAQKALHWYPLPPELARWGVLVHCKKGAVVVGKNQKTEHVYLVLAGALLLQTDLADGNFYSYARLGPTHYAGDMEVLSGKYEYVATLIAEDNTELMRFPVDAFEEALQNNVGYLRHVVRQMSLSLYETSYNRGQNRYLSARQRLCRMLLRHYSMAPGQRVRVAATRQQLASIIGVTVRTVDRAVKALCDEGLIGLSRGKIELSSNQYQRLRALMELE